VNLKEVPYVTSGTDTTGGFSRGTESLMPRQRYIAQLLFALTQSIGRQSANQELNWMKRATHAGCLKEMLERRVQGEPLQYILGGCTPIFIPVSSFCDSKLFKGTQPFGPLDLLTRAPILIPRPETENWAIRLAELLQPTIERPLSVLDLCTGSGCIPLLLCHLWARGSTRAYGVDISDHAVELAKDNAARCGIPDVASPHHFSNVYTPYLANVLDATFRDSLPRSFDVITSNPPYIPLNEYHQLPRSVKDYEDPRALLGDLPDSPGTDGLTFYHAIARLVARDGVLNEGDQAMVVLEVGDKQAAAVESILKTEGRLNSTEIWLDPWGKQRVVVGRRT
jgi:release factor glutamine methyltransferase